MNEILAALATVYQPMVIQTFDQSDVQTKRQKYEKVEGM